MMQGEAARFVDPTFSLHKLRVLREVAEKQSVTLAAKALFVTQPVVSSHIRDLERFFGAKLFIRSGRRMLLTEAGRSVFAYSRELARFTAETLTVVRLHEQGDTGRVVLGASETPGCYLLPVWLGDFRLANPGAEITMDVLGADEIGERTSQGHYDFGVVGPMVSGESRDVRLDLLYEEPLVIICAPRHALAHRPAVGPAELATQFFVTHSDRPDDWLQRRLRLFGFEAPPISLSVGTSEAMKRAVRTGVGIAAVYQCTVEQELGRGELVEVSVSGSRPTRPFWLVHARSKRFSPLQARLLRYLRRRARSEHPPLAAAEVIGTTQS